MTNNKAWWEDDLVRVLAACFDPQDKVTINWDEMKAFIKEVESETEQRVRREFAEEVLKEYKKQYESLSKTHHEKPQKAPENTVFHQIIRSKLPPLLHPQLGMRE